MQHLQAIRTASIQAKKAPRESWAEVMKVAQPSLNLWVTTEAETAGGITASLVSAAPPLGRAADRHSQGHGAGYSRGRVQRISNAETFEGTSAERTFYVLEEPPPNPPSQLAQA